MRKFSRFSARASWMVVGLRMRAMGIWKVVEEKVQIKQKVIRYRPIEKLLDGFILILAGGRGISEVNTRVRPDEMLQAAFGRDGCADQSTVSETLNACDGESVAQLQEAVQTIYQAHSRAYDHDYGQNWQVLDIDMTGLPAGVQGEGVTKGYFALTPKRRGRQLGRVIATWYDEIVWDRLYAGNRQLHASLQDLVLGSEQVLNLQRTERQRTVLRIDGGGGETEHINWELRRGYLILVKAQGWQRIDKMAQQVTTWTPDPHDPDRQVAWAPCPYAYHKPTRQLLVRTRTQTGTWSYSLLVSNAPQALLTVLGHVPIRHTVRDLDLMLAMLYAYDRRGGAAETQFKGDKQGLFLAKRNKRSFAAQQILVLLAQLAHNLLIWTRNALPDALPTLHHLGILRLVRDVLTIPGKIELDAQGHLLTITLNQRCPFAAALVQAFSAALSIDGLSLNLGEI
jgi:Transposase DDE domain group 1